MPESKTPRFSVLVPAFNAQATLARTVESVLAQSFGDWELVIVDDGSTDDTPSMARRFQQDDERIRVVTQENRGTAEAYNTAVRAARSDMLVMLCADDHLLPQHLERMNELIESNPDAGIFSCGGYLDFEDGRRIEQPFDSHWSDPKGCTVTDLFNGCFFGVGAMFRRNVYDDVGGFRPDHLAEDYMFWIVAVARGYKHRSLPTPLAVHALSANQRSADTVAMHKSKMSIITEAMGSGLLTPAEMRAGRTTLRKEWVMMQLARIRFRKSR